MARKRQSFGDDLIGLMMSTPWWYGLLAIFIIYIFGTCIAMLVGDDKLGTRSLFDLIRNLITVAAAIAWAFSIIVRLTRRIFFNSQGSIEDVRKLSWRQFETYVGELYRRQGYNVEETGGGGADGGVDLIARNATETILIQCKQWKSWKIGAPKVRELYGVLHAEKATSAVLITCGVFTRPAQDFAEGKPIRLIAGDELAKLIAIVRQADTPSSTIAAPSPGGEQNPARQQLVCPQCNSPMMLRTAKRGANEGNQFYGCTRYPACRGTRDQ